jgi:aspartyl/asparaginyl beta-hydroxylase (cupin superfamily)
MAQLNRIKRQCRVSLGGWAARVGREWRTIREELDRALLRKNKLPEVQDLAIDATAIIRDAGWKIFVLVAYAIRSAPNIAHCPQTWRIVQKIPGLKTAMFSIFDPVGTCHRIAVPITAPCGFILVYGCPSRAPPRASV